MCVSHAFFSFRRPHSSKHAYQCSVSDGHRQQGRTHHVVMLCQRPCSRAYMTIGSGTHTAVYSNEPMCMAASKPLIALKRSWNRFWSGGSRRAAWSWSSTNSTWTCGDTALYLTPASASASSAWCDDLRSLFPLTDFTPGYQAAVFPTQPEFADLARQQCLLVSLHDLASLQQQEFEFERVLMGVLLGRADMWFLVCAGAVRDRSGEHQVIQGLTWQAHCISDSSSRLPFP